jgi:predicted RNA binding protein YcfA (HicA-like mRNA interferase family)
MRPAKTWRAVLAGSRNVRFEDALRLAEAFGFAVRRVRGSHHILLHPDLQQGLNLQPGADGKAKPYQLRQLADLVERHGLRLKD